MTDIRYEVEIIGHRAPYEWKLYRTGANYNHSLIVGAAGLADSQQEAAFDARDRAVEEHDKWVHARVKQTLEVFTGSSVVPGDVPVEVKEHPATAAPLDPAERDRFLGGFMD